MTEGVVRGLVLQAQDDAPPGLLDGWAAARGIALHVARVDLGVPLPEPGAGHAFAVALGSAASVADPRDAWIAGTIDWLRAADAASLPVLGICFGAQALAAALGGRVRRLPRPEIGWIEVETRDEARLPAGPWLSWHEDGLMPPPAARELARSDAGTQAFRLRRHLGVQFHPEVTPAIVAGWADAGGAALAGAGLARGELDRATAAFAAAVAPRAERLFDGFLEWAGLAGAAGVGPRPEVGS